MEAVDRRAATVQERLEADLNGYKNNMIKESIRMGHHELVRPAPCACRCTAGCNCGWQVAMQSRRVDLCSDLRCCAGGSAGIAQGGSYIGDLIAWGQSHVCSMLGSTLLLTGPPASCIVLHT